MKTTFTLLLLTFNALVPFAFGQTFTNATTQTNGWSGATSITKTFIVSGIGILSSSNVLRQINIDFGDNSSSYSWFRVNMTLTSPAGTVIQIGNNVASGTGDFGSTNATRLMPKYRDHSQLYTIGEYAGLPAGSSLNGEPYHLGYYRVKTANSFASVNGQNANGTWTLTVSTNGSTSLTKPQFNFASIIFGNSFNINNVSSANGYDQCTGAQCLQTDMICIADDIGFADPGATTDPNTTLAGCAWNNIKNNTSWYKFTATGTTATITASAYVNQHQIVAVENTGTCSSPIYSVLAGGCPFGQINYTNSGGNYNASGTAFNHQLSLSGLTAGTEYYIIIDGTGLSGSGNNSQFYLELAGGAICTFLPIELIDFSGKTKIESNEISWKTGSESNNWYFILERSLDMLSFQEIARIDGKGTFSTESNYSISDRNLTPLQTTYFYRLKQIDYSGLEKIEEKIIVLNRENKLSNPSIYGNHRTIAINLNQEMEIQKGFLRITNSNGILLLSEEFPPMKTDVILINKELSSGVYFADLTVNGEQIVLKFIVQ